MIALETMTLEVKILLGITYLISGAIVYSKTYGLTKHVRQILTWTPVVGVIYFLLSGKNPVENSLTFGLLTGPIVVGLLYELFDMICWKLNKRSFHLHAIGAKDMKGLGLPCDNNHYKRTDIFFSVFLILMWVGWPMIFVVIIHLTTK
ncbi:MAG: hypothetical protein SGI89_09060 [bacterium]|nr:hypothetical protein [bacterium]